FTPVLEFLAALANRRLQPLGHLTANAKCNGNQHFVDRNFTFAVIGGGDGFLEPSLSLNSPKKGSDFAIAAAECGHTASVGTLSEDVDKTGMAGWRALCGTRARNH